MSCLLRAYGNNFDVLKFSKRIKIPRAEIYLKGSPRFPKTNPNGPKIDYSGIKILISKKEMDNLEGQIKDAIKYLKTNKNKLTALVKYKGVSGVKIDFGIEKRNAHGQFDYFPPELLLLSGQIGMGLELSNYITGNKTKRKKHDILNFKKY